MENNARDKFKSSLKVFLTNLGECEQLSAIYRYLENNGVKFATKNILRAEHVLAVSAFDFYIHELIKYGIAGVVEGDILTNKYNENFKLSLKLMKDWANSDISKDKKTANLFEEITSQNSTQTFQDPDKVADGLKQITNKEIWLNVSKIGNPKVENQSEKDYNKFITTKTAQNKEQLRLIVKRRNSIAHSFDKVVLGENTQTTDIYLEDVEGTVEFLKLIGESIYKLLTTD